MKETVAVLGRPVHLLSYFPSDTNAGDFHPLTYLASFVKWMQEEFPSAFIQVVSRDIRLSLSPPQAYAPKESSGEGIFVNEPKQRARKQMDLADGNPIKIYHTLIRVDKFKSR